MFDMIGSKELIIQSLGQILEKISSTEKHIAAVHAKQEDFIVRVLDHDQDIDKLKERLNKANNDISSLYKTLSTLKIVALLLAGFTAFSITTFISLLGNRYNIEIQRNENESTENFGTAFNRPQPTRNIPTTILASSERLSAYYRRKDGAGDFDPIQGIQDRQETNPIKRYRRDNGQCPD